MTALYNALWYPALPFALIAGGGLDAVNRRERLGTAAVASNTPGSPRIWLHAASVGEVEAVRPVARGLMSDYPDAMVVVTTMTAAGRAAARKRIAGAAAYQLAPLDCPASVRSFLAAVRPQIVLVAETELWPNYLIEGARSGAKVAIVNGRVSARSASRYRYIRPLIAEALAHTHLVLVQTDDDARRFRDLGAPPANVVVTGNTKFNLDDAAPLRSALEQFCAHRPVLVAGSTAPGEERMVLTAYRNLVERFPTLALVLAPRHLSRAGEIEDQIRSAGFAYEKASLLPPDGAPGVARFAPPARDDAAVLLLDTMGELRALYTRATIAFVGGSMLPPRGGQNMAEPAAVAVPVLFGPHYENQQQAGDTILEAGGGRVVLDAAQIESTCSEWLADHDERRNGPAAPQGLRTRRNRC